MLDEIFKEVARKRKIPEEQVKLVYMAFADCTRHYLNDPFRSKGRILVPRIGAFKITNKSALSLKGEEGEKLLNYTKQYAKKQKQ